MRIVIDGRLLLPNMTGIGRYIYGLSQALNQIAQEDEIELWLQANIPESHPIWKLARENFTLHQLNINHMNIQQQVVIPPKVLRSHPHVFHYPHFDLPLFVPGSIVATIYDLKYITRPNFFPRLSSIKRFIIWSMMWFTVHRAKQVIAISEHTRKDILRFLGVNPQKVIVVPLGVENQYFIKPCPKKLNDIRDRYSLTYPFILFIGERRPHKNIPALIKAYQLLNKNRSIPHHLVVIGKSYSDYKMPERLVSDYELSNRIHFLDYINDVELSKFYWLSDIFVTLSLYEGVGLPVLEAMASCTPVVAAQRTSLPEIVGSAGFLVDPDNLEQVAQGIFNILSKADIRQTYIKRGIERARKFSWERCAKETLAVYKQTGDL